MPDGPQAARLRKQAGGLVLPAVLPVVLPVGAPFGERPVDPAAVSFAAAKIPIGNSALTMISVWLGA
jgi:hypothetical protein